MKTKRKEYTMLTTNKTITVLTLFLIIGLLFTLNSKTAFAAKKTYITVKGQFVFADERNDSKTSFELPDDGHRGAANVKYQIFLKQNNSEQVVATGLTDWDGKFKSKIKFINPPDTTFKTYVIFSLKNNKFYVESPLEKLYTIMVFPMAFNPSHSQTVDFGTKMPYVGSEFHHALHVYATINEAWNYGSVNDWDQGDVLRVIWPNYKVKNGKIVLKADGNPEGNGMSNATANRIELNFGKWNKPGVAYHEYGHVMQKRIVPLYFPGYCLLEKQNTEWTSGCWHSFKGQEQKGTGLIEGWAHLYKYVVADFVIPEINNNHFVAYDQAEYRDKNIFDDQNEGNAAAVLVDLMDHHYDSHPEFDEHFELYEKTNSDGSTWFYYDLDQVLPAGSDKVEWNFSGLLYVLKRLSLYEDLGEVGIKEYMDEVDLICDDWNWECSSPLWDDKFDSMTKTGWVNLEEDTAPVPYEWTPE